MFGSRRSRWISHRSRGWALLLLCLAACRPTPDESRQTYADLVAAFPASIVRQEARIPAFETLGSTLGDTAGFSDLRQDESRNRTFVWSNRQTSRTSFELFETRPLVLKLEARASRTQDGRGQTVEIALNGKQVKSVVIPRKLTALEIPLPADSVRSGRNELEFSYPGFKGSPSRGDTRFRSIAWYRLSVNDQERADPFASSERGLLFVPFGSEVSYLVEMRPETHWVADRVSFKGADTGQLQVLTETDSDGIVERAIISGAGDQTDLDLDQQEMEPVRFVLRARGSSEDPQAGALVSRPRLTAPIRPQARRELRPAKELPNVIIYLVDTLRADHLGCFGYDKLISPSVDAFAEKSVVFERAIGQSSWTRSSVASLFTGQWPVSHGAVGRRDKLPDEAFTLAEGLTGRGYSSTAFVTNANVDARFGLGQGFNAYHQIHELVRSDKITDRVLHWLRKETREEPLFLYIHTIDPHDRYTPSPEFLRRFAPGSAEFLEGVYRRRHRDAKPRSPGALDHLKALYDAEIAENDASFGRLLEGLRELGLYEDSLIVFMSDHGEEFLEHDGFAHGKNLFGTTLDFPLIVKFPHQQSGFRTERPAQHADLLPTIFELAGVPIPPSVEGRSFADLADGDAERGAAGPIYSHLDLDLHPHSSLVDGDWKLIRKSVPDRPERFFLFNLAEDPDEKEDLSVELPIRTAVMASRLEAHFVASEARAQRQAIELDEDLERSLRALGYLQ